MKKPNGYWNYERCYEEAKKYHSRKEFRKGNQSAYNAALKNKWMDDYYWFEELRKPHNYWNYDTCYGAAHKYTSRNEFRKGNGSAYQVALNNGWINDYYWLTPSATIKKWNYETCYEVAQKCVSRSELGKKYHGAYKVALKSGWIDDYTWLHNDIIYKKDGKIDSVYVYEFKEQNCAYVGRTVKWQQTDRYYAHCTKIEKDAVAKFAYENNLTVPEPIYLEQGITLAEGVRLEEYWEKKYREDGWIMLNRAKTGSIGSLGVGKWTRKACYREAKKYDSMYDFYKYSGSAHTTACKKGWINDYDWLIKKKKPNTYWENYEFNKAEAIKYPSKHEFAKRCSGAYKVALRNGWLDGYTWFEELQKPNGYWNNYENNKAKAMEYSSRSEFNKCCGAAYNAARLNNWLNDYTWFEEMRKPNGYWNNYESCRNAAKECKGRGEFKKKYSRAYDVANDNGWLDEFFPENKKESD